MSAAGEWIRVRGARTHNLHNLDLDLPRGKLIVLTGPSGSGKSSLAFDTLFAEGQRRYLETLRTGSRALFDALRRPDVDLVEGLPPVLCVSQHTGSPRPRSTLATVTEIHDHMRLLWARRGIPHCWQCGAALAKHTLAEIVREMLELPEGTKLFILAPLIADEPGTHAEAFQMIRQSGFLRARVDGVLFEIRDIPKIDPNKPHSIDLVVDRLVVRPGMEDRFRDSLQTAVKLGEGRVIVSDTDDGDWRDRTWSTRLLCPRCRIVIEEPTPRHFHFNHPAGACPRCAGLGHLRQLDPGRVVPDRTWPLMKVLAHLNELLPEHPILESTAKSVLGHDIKEPLSAWSDEDYRKLFEGDGDSFVGLLPALEAIATSADDDDFAEAMESLSRVGVCPECQGARLHREARAVRYAGKGIHEVNAWTVDAAAAFFVARCQSPVTDRVEQVLLKEIATRLHFLREVGLGYLALERAAPTLSGGEFQRARLATQLGGGLLGVCYILDEPTMGLHPRDTDRLIAALRGLQQRGNTVLVVEHDEAVMQAADYLVDIGPGAGKEGGRLLAAGMVAEVAANPSSVTGPYLRGDIKPSPSPQANVDPPFSSLVIRGARQHNLKNIDVAIPLGRLVCVTGVSGSGKSTLIRDILSPAVRRHLGLAAPLPGVHERIDGMNAIDQIIEVDHKPIGRSARSSPATYTGLLDDIRKVFAATRTAKIRGYKANRFSFNVKGGRCEECLGQGEKRVALPFLPDLAVPCSACGGRRFNSATLEVLFKGKSIAEVLDLSVADARAFFANVPALDRTLAALDDIGLGYLSIGQPANQLSGGEAQRVKLAAELARTATGRTLFLLDEPTTGLHHRDIEPLLRVFRRLVETGNTVVVIEHHLDVIASADWIIDLGPEAGDAGGQLVVAGTPADVRACAASVTGRFLPVTPSAWSGSC
jgi:excinuclease ABC subunit A